MKSIQIRIMAGVIVTALICSTVSLLLVRQNCTGRQGTMSQSGLGRRAAIVNCGTAVAKTMGSAVLPLLLEQNVMAISELCTSVKVPGVVYFFVTNSGGKLIASSLGKNFPKGLASANIPKGNSVSVAPLKGISGKKVYDIAFPLEGGIGTVHVGMNANAEKTDNKATPKKKSTFKSTAALVLLITLLVAGLASLLICKLVDSPIAELAGVVSNLCDGKLASQINSTQYQGNIGKLARSIERLQAKLEVRVER